MISFPCRDPAAFQRLSSVDVDCSIKLKYSILQTTFLQWSRSTMRPSDDCLALRVEIIQSEPAREENKVKLLQVIVM